MWDDTAEGFGAACHFSRLNSLNDTVQSAAMDVAEHTLQPLRAAGESRVFLASEAFAPLQCWSEGALQMAENALHRLAVPRPSWLDADVYNQTLFDSEVASADDVGAGAAFAL